MRPVLGRLNLRPVLLSQGSDFVRPHCVRRTKEQFDLHPHAGDFLRVPKDKPPAATGNPQQTRQENVHVDLQYSPPFFGAELVRSQRECSRPHDWRRYASLALGGGSVDHRSPPTRLTLQVFATASLPVPKNRQKGPPASRTTAVILASGDRRLARQVARTRWQGDLTPTLLLVNAQGVFEVARVIRVF